MIGIGESVGAPRLAGIEAPPGITVGNLIRLE